MEAEFHAILNRTNSLANLSKVQQTTPDLVVAAAVMPKELLQEAPIGYMTPGHEDEYLSALDTYLASLPPEAPPILQRSSRPTDREREKEMQLRNPVSVYNWLREYKPKVFLQDPRPEEKESAPDKVSNVPESAGHKASPKPPSSSTTKRRPAPAPKQEAEPEPEILDDEGNVIGGTGIDPPAPKSKRKREDDAYRPKGGSSRSRKKAKGSSGAVVRKTEGEEEG